MYTCNITFLDFVEDFVPQEMISFNVLCPRASPTDGCHKATIAPGVLSAALVKESFSLGDNDKSKDRAVLQ